MRLFLADEKIELPEVAVLEKLEVCVALLNHMRQNKSNVDGRGLSIAITHIETAALWVKDAVREEG
jgi:hypothetical protein